jgi:hypothetical protein
VCHRPNCVTRGFHRRPDRAAGHLHCIINSIAARSSIARRGRRHSSAGLVSSSMLRPPREGHAHAEDTGTYGHPLPCRGARILARSRSSRGTFSGADWMIYPAPHQIAGIYVVLLTVTAPLYTSSRKSFVEFLCGTGLLRRPRCYFFSDQLLPPSYL